MVCVPPTLLQPCRLREPPTHDGRLLIGIGAFIMIPVLLDHNTKAARKLLSLICTMSGLQILKGSSDPVTSVYIASWLIVSTLAGPCQNLITTQTNNSSRFPNKLTSTTDLMLRCSAWLSGNEIGSVLPHLSLVLLPFIA